MNNKYTVLDEYKKFSNHLGNFTPYIVKNKTKKLFLNMEEIVYNTNNRELDLVGIVEMVNKSYLLGDRTLLKDVKRLSWMTSYEKFESKYNLVENLPEHNNEVVNIKDFSNNFKELLKKELINYIENKKSIGIMLSGGLDSRIVSGILKELQNDSIYKGKVTAFTWGEKNSIDVTYAREIAKRFKWEFIEIELNSEVLLENIYISGKAGAEFSPIHLHGMKVIRDYDGIDAVIGGSYGDGVGKGRFSGKKIEKLKKTVPRKLNSYGILREKVIEESLQEVYKDAYEYKRFIQREEMYQYYEIEQELHYMRRKLNACMQIIGEKKPVFQMFTDPLVFKEIWKLDPKIRNEELYNHILLTLPESIGLLPYNSNGTINKELIGKKTQQNYGRWLRVELNQEIKQLVLSDNLASLEIFNMDSLLKLISIWEKQTTESINGLDGLISWLASLSVFISENDIKMTKGYETDVQDKIYGILSPLKTAIYLKIRSFFRK